MLEKNKNDKKLLTFVRRYLLGVSFIIVVLTTIIFALISYYALENANLANIFVSLAISNSLASVVTILIEKSKDEVDSEKHDEIKNKIDSYNVPTHDEMLSFLRELKTCNIDSDRKILDSIGGLFRDLDDKNTGMSLYRRRTDVEFRELIPSSKSINIYVTNPTFLNSYISEFKKVAKNNNGKIRFLVIHPENLFISTRFHELGFESSDDFFTEIKSGILELKRIHNELNKTRTGSSEMRLYCGQPTHMMFMFDNIIFFSLILRNGRAREQFHIKFDLEKPNIASHAEDMKNAFEKIWVESKTIEENLPLPKQYNKMKANTIDEKIIQYAIHDDVSVIIWHKEKYAKVFEGLHKYSHLLRNTKYNILNNGQDASDGALINMLEKFSIEAIDLIADSMCVLCDGGERAIFACIKRLEYSKWENSSISIEDREKVQYFTLCRSKNSPHPLQRDDSIPRLIKENFEFVDIFVNGKSDCWLPNIVGTRAYNESHEKINKNYHQYYNNSIVVPIRIKEDILYPDRTSNERNLFGFVCVCYLDDEAIKESEIRQYCDFLKIFADSMYMIFDEVYQLMSYSKESKEKDGAQEEELKKEVTV